MSEFRHTSPPQPTTFSRTPVHDRYNSGCLGSSHVVQSYRHHKPARSMFGCPRPPQHSNRDESTRLIQSLHDDIRRHLEVSNEHYKELSDAHRRPHEFQEGDYVMIRVRPERFPSGTVKKLQAHGVGPFRVLKCVGSNAYVVDLPDDF